MDGLPTACSRVLRAINNGQGEKVTVYGFSTSVELSQFTASYASVTTRSKSLSLRPTFLFTSGMAHPRPQPARPQWQFVITPGFQLGFEPNPQNTFTIPLGDLKGNLESFFEARRLRKKQNRGQACDLRFCTTSLWIIRMQTSTRS